MTEAKIFYKVCGSSSQKSLILFFINIERAKKNIAILIALSIFFFKK